jgi:hypothetical protein
VGCGRRDHARRCRHGVDEHAEHDPGFVVVDGGVEVIDGSDRMAREHRVVEFGAAPLMQRAVGRVIAALLRNA